jgi:methionyl-tRNA formyltransferase
MNIALIAEESAGIQVLATLLQSEHRIVAVLASPGNSRFPRANVFLAAKKQGLPVWPAELVKDAGLSERLRTERVDLILNVHSLYLIHDEVLRAPRIGAFNLHPGPLPRYAGLHAPSWAIYHGETTHGVTLHKMVPDIDAGPIVFQQLFPICCDDTPVSVSAKCVKYGLELIRKLLEVATRDASCIPATPQNLADREYHGKNAPNDGCLCWDWPAAKIVNFVRACDYAPFRSPWGYPTTEGARGNISVLKATRTHIPCSAAPGTVGQIVGPSALVASADEWVAVHTVRVQNTSMSASEALQPGQRLSSRPCLADAKVAAE